MIKIEDLDYYVGQQRILSNISTQIPKGGVTALIGPNGAGKSTLFAHIARLLPIQKGKVTIDNMDITQTASNIMAKKVAILRQDNSISSRITVESLLLFGRYPYHKGNPKDEDRFIVEDTLRHFQLKELRHRFVTELSGGQRQRVMVAMVFCQSTDYLLLDEPLNNLDMYYSRQLMRQLRHIADQYRRTVIVVLHDVNYASAYADHIIGMKNGQVLLEGRPKDILTSEHLDALFGVHAPVINIQGHHMVMHYL